MKEKHQPAEFGCIKLGLQVGLGFGFNHVWRGTIGKLKSSLIP